VLNRFIQLVQSSIQKLLTLHNWVGLQLPIDNVSMAVGHSDHVLSDWSNRTEPELYAVGLIPISSHKTWSRSWCPTDMEIVKR